MKVLLIRITGYYEILFYCNFQKNKFYSRLFLLEKPNFQRQLNMGPDLMNSLLVLNLNLRHNKTVLYSS